MIVLDTSVISEVLRERPDPRVVAWLTSLDGEVAITSVTLGELLAGLRRLPSGRRRTALSEAVETALLPYRESRAILPFDDAAAEHYAEVLVQRERAGLSIATADAQSAAICRANSAVCATRNTRDFVSTGIDLVDPWAS